MSTWKHMNESLTRTIIGKINGLPAPVKVAIGFLPGGGAATSYADVHRWTIVRAAEHYQKEGKLSKESSTALSSYKTALEAEQRAYERLLRSLEKDV